MKGQWLQTNRDKGATPGWINHTLRATLQKIPSHHRSPTAFCFSRYMGKEGRNQTRSTQPRHTQGLNHFRTEPPPSPQGSGTAAALSSMAAGPEGENRMQMKGEDVGEGAELSSLFTPRPSFLPKQSLHCYPVVTVPQNV